METAYNLSNGRDGTGGQPSKHRVCLNFEIRQDLSSSLICLHTLHVSIDMAGLFQSTTVKEVDTK